MGIPGDVGGPGTPGLPGPQGEMGLNGIMVSDGLVIFSTYTEIPMLINLFIPRRSLGNYIEKQRNTKTFHHKEVTCKLF